VAGTTADMSHKALEMGKEAAERYQAQQLAARATPAPGGPPPPAASVTAPIDSGAAAQEAVSDLLAAGDTDEDLGTEHPEGPRPGAP